MKNSLIKCFILASPIIGCNSENMFVEKSIPAQVKPNTESLDTTQLVSVFFKNNDLNFVFTPTEYNDEVVSYTICEKDTSQENNCLELATQNSLALIKDENNDYLSTIHDVPLLKTIDKEFFVKANYGEGVHLSNEMNIDLSSTHEAITFFKAAVPQKQSYYGSQVEISADGNVLAISSFWEITNGDKGSIYIYKNTSSNTDKPIWELAHHLTIENNESLGTTLSLSEDGDRLVAVGSAGQPNVYLFSNLKSEDNVVTTLVDTTSIAPGVNFFEAMLSKNGEFVYVGDVGDVGDVGLIGWRISEDPITNHIDFELTTNMESTDRIAGYSMDTSSDNLVAVSFDANYDAYGDSRSFISIFEADVNSSLTYLRVPETYIREVNSDLGSNDELMGFGHSVSMSGNGAVVAVGAPYENSAATGVDSFSDYDANESGAVFVYRVPSKDDWGTVSPEIAYLKSSNPDEGDWFGWDVTLSEDGNTLFVSAQGERSNSKGLGGDQYDNSAKSSGAVYMFKYEEGQWQQTHYIKSKNTKSNDSFRDRFGISIDVSSDGYRLIVGASGEDTGLNGVYATQSGAAYIY